MFAAIIIGLLSVQISHWMDKKKMTIKLPSALLPNVAAPFQAMMPLVVNVIFGCA